MSWPFGDLPRNDAGVVLADPAWTFQTYSAKGEGRSPQAHYSTMALDDIKALPVADLCRADCWLFLWVTGPHLAQGLEVITAWGFRYSGLGFVWVKTNPRAPTLFQDAGSWFMGLGHTTRKNAEICLLARRGAPKRKSKSVRELIISPRRRHSEKPPETQERIEQFADGPYVDLFSRRSRAGWTSWGNEAGKFDRVAA